MDRFQWLEFENTVENRPAADYFGAPVPSAESLYEQATNLYLDGKFEDALRTYGRACQENSELVMAWVWQVYCQLAMEDLDTAMAWGLRLEERFPNQSVCLSTYAYVLAHTSAYANSYDLIMQAVDSVSGPIDNHILLHLVFCLISVNKIKEAEKQIVLLHSRISNDSGWLQLVGSMLMDAQQPELARQFLEAASAQMPERAWIWYLIGLCQAKLKNRQAAISALDRAIELGVYAQDAAMIRNGLIDQRSATSTISEAISSFFQSSFSS